MFIGRKRELELLKRLKNKKSASLLCVLGRRRIGKSALINEFAKSGFKKFIEIQGLGPDIQPTAQDQRNHFASRMSDIFDTKKEYFENWTDALTSLAKKTQKGSNLIFLDEISWMAQGAPLFPSELKSAWDTFFKKNPGNVMVVCGSVSSWIEENILKNINFVGRISLEINLQELQLPEINSFFECSNSRMGSLEKMMILSVTGGVPKYLEEVLLSESASDNIIKMCFTPEGLLFKEYDKIFHETIGRKSKSLEKIIRTCLSEKLSVDSVSKRTCIPHGHDLSEYIHILEISGFLSRDYYFKPDGKVSKLSHLRVKDNYLRFYLKYIEPQKQKILKGGKTYRSFSDIKGFESIWGLQFENLILANRKLLQSFLKISDQNIVTSAPYVQRKTAKNKGACQIDLLIQTDLDVFYLCEMKCQRTILLDVIKEVEYKIKILNLPKRTSIKPVLIYAGEIDPRHQNIFESFFYRIISIDEIFNAKPVI